jgi:hypothetical protein
LDGRPKVLRICRRIIETMLHIGIVDRPHKQALAGVQIGVFDIDEIPARVDVIRSVQRSVGIANG